MNSGRKHGRWYVDTEGAIWFEDSLWRFVRRWISVYLDESLR